ncbi:MAG: RseA family anti-sigma factor [Brachymonas sp.]|nr:RseA family anti-sigma factor [Brachymonas sp.]
MDTGKSLLPDKDVLFEALSAWMDGEALPDGVRQEQLWRWLRDDAQARQLWHDWHAAGVCLREPGQVSLTGSGAASPWMAQLQQRLAEETLPQLQTQPVPLQMPAPQTRPAANDAAWRWRAAGGVASVLLVALLGWNLMRPHSAAPDAAAVVMASRPATGQAAPESTAVAPSPAPRTTVPGTESTVVAKSPTGQTLQADAAEQEGLLALMAAHAQLGDPLLMQNATSPEKDEVF